MMMSKLVMLFSMMFLILAMFMLLNNSLFIYMIPIIKINNIMMSADIMLDWLSMMFLSTVLFISSLILLFSLYYINMKEQYKFMLMMLLFILSMSILTLSNNMFLLLLGWDGLGLSSYVLVIYYQNFTSAASGSITLITNRIGDIMILMSMGMLMILMNWSYSMKSEFMKISLFLLLMAACSKSAQFPFSAWLPMAMAAPTPISALVHSSTLVTAGVFLSLRVMLYHNSISFLMMLISSITAIYASLTACWENDLKKIIAYSTLSQIAMMMFAISMNAHMLAFIHLIIHAIFKSTMFLCAGSMIHESMYQDMRMMGMNMNYLLIPSSTLSITSMALMGAPFMSGFFSKDYIIENLISTKMESILTIMMILSIGMTSSYSIRMISISNKWYMKSYPNLSNHLNINSIFPMIIMSPLSISSGSILSWLLIPNQMFMMNNFLKMNIILILLMGMLMGFFLMNKPYLISKLGMSIISIWFLHILSVISKKKLSNSMKIFLKNDKQWQENYGPQKLYFLKMISSMKITLVKKSTLMLLILMIMMIPATMLLY